MQQIIIGAKDHVSFWLSRPVIEDLFKRRPELFGTPMPADEMRTAQDQSDAELVDQYEYAVLHDGHLHFLDDTDGARTDPLLLEQLRANGPCALSASDIPLRIVEIPEDVEWYVFEADDGTESIHEKHRVWR